MHTGVVQFVGQLLIYTDGDIVEVLTWGYSQRENVSGLSSYISRNVNGRNVGSAAVLAAA